MSIMLQTTTSAFNKFLCLYLPADDPPVLADWYKEHFNSCNTRKHTLFWGPKKENVVNCNFMTDEYIPGETYEMFAVRFETDCIEALYERLSKAGVALESLQDLDHEGSSFVFTDPQGNKFQVWQHPDTEPQPLRDDVPALIGVTTLFFPVANPEETRKWYSEVSGLEINDSGWPSTRKGQEIRFYRSLDLGPTQPYHRLWSIINIAVDDLDAMHHQMLKQEHKVANIHDRGGCGRQFQLYDPDGNMLDIWQPQTMICRSKFDSFDYNWKREEQYCMANSGFDENEEPAGWDIDSFLARVKKSDLKHRRVVIPGYNVLQKLDPEGLESLLETLHQFSLEHPQHAFEIIKRDWCPTDPIEPAAMEDVADIREVFLPLTERAEGILKIYGNKSNSPNWKDRIVLMINFFIFDFDTFFTKALEGRHEIFQQVKINYDEASVPWYLKKIDPDAVMEFKLAVEQFNQEHPDHAIELIE